MKKETKQLIKKGSAVSFLMIGVIVALVILMTMNVPEIVSTGGQRGWQNLASAADADPGAGNGGVLNIFIDEHSADPGTDYATNLTEGGVMAYGHLNSHLTGNVDYDVAFDIVVKCRFNVSQAYNSTGSTWMMDWVRANITCSDLGISALTPMTAVQVATNSQYMWVQFYINNGGSGYTITHGEFINATTYRVQAYW